MLSVLKSLSDADARRDLAGRLGAWWEGRDYVPAADDDGSANGEGRPSASVPPRVPGHARSDPAGEGADPRILALEAMWGAGRLSPGSDELDEVLLDAVFEGSANAGDIGFIGADAALLTAARRRSERALCASEWRRAAVPRLRELAPFARIEEGDVDRPRGFADGTLAALVSIEAFTFADHKAGLVSRVHRALTPAGGWVFLEPERRTGKAPPAAFASAWAEPQAASEAEIRLLLDAAGFRSVHRIEVGALVERAVGAAFARIAGELDGWTRRGGPHMLRELAWEMESWRARRRAVEGGALGVGLWFAAKPEGAANPFVRDGAGAAAASGGALDQSAVDALFD